MVSGRHRRTASIAFANATTPTTTTSAAAAVAAAAKATPATTTTTMTATTTTMTTTLRGCSRASPSRCRPVAVGVAVAGAVRGVAARSCGVSTFLFHAIANFQRHGVRWLEHAREKARQGRGAAPGRPAARKRRGLSATCAWNCRPSALRASRLELHGALQAARVAVPPLRLHAAL